MTSGLPNLLGGGAFRVLTRSSRVSFAQADFYDFSAKTLDGKETSMSDFKGKPTLILNVASL